MEADHLIEFVHFPSEKTLELIKRLGPCIGRDGVSLPIAKDVAGAERDASAMLKRLIQANALHDEVLQVIADSQSDDPPVRLGGAVRALDGLLSGSAAGAHIRHHCDNESRALDLTPEDIKAFAASSGSGGAAGQIESVIVPHLATRIRARVDKLASFTDVRPGLSFGYRTVSLPKVLAARAARLEELRQECDESRREAMREAASLKQVAHQFFNNPILHAHKQNSRPPCFIGCAYSHTPVTPRVRPHRSRRRRSTRWGGWCTSTSSKRGRGATSCVNLSWWPTPRRK